MLSGTLIDQNSIVRPRQGYSVDLRPLGLPHNKIHPRITHLEGTIELQIVQGLLPSSRVSTAIREGFDMLGIDYGNENVSNTP